MMNRLKSHLIVLLLLFSGALHAQIFSSRLFNEENGLAQKFIFSISQDKNDVLVLGTEKGVATFNGDRFFTYNVSCGLAEDHVSAVFVDSRGITWAGHFQKGISCIINGIATVADSSASVNGRINSF